MKQSIINCLAVIGAMSLLVSAAVFTICALTKTKDDELSGE